MAVALLAALVLPSPAAGESRAEPPNVVVIMTDDQDFRSMPVMPKTRRLIGREGVTFDRNFVNYPLCCPSRATFLTGQYAHNHGVLWNNWPRVAVHPASWDGAQCLRLARRRGVCAERSASFAGRKPT